ncbi:hypothetical protein F4604DRAFT_1918509 [Suillus subluteus]|nr:hypothetical protein F4604DRAFT_1918509 [Suillus subluteus]
MANLIRSSKSGSDWTFYELMAYNITVTAQPPEQFFCRNPEPLLAGDEDVSDATFEYLGYLDLATNASQGSFLNTFGNASQPEPQVIASAIAAYQNNNEKRQFRSLHQAFDQSMVKI